jgi:HlyD family secretion protein
VLLAEELPPNLLPGLSADIEVILDAHDDVLRIPTYALLDGDRVLVVEGDRLVARQLGVGLQNWRFAEVREGLELGERVVTSLDRPEVVEGARVVVEKTIR